MVVFPVTNSELKVEPIPTPSPEIVSSVIVDGPTENPRLDVLPTLRTSSNPVSSGLLTAVLATPTHVDVLASNIRRSPLLTGGYVPLVGAPMFTSFKSQSHTAPPPPRVESC